MGRVLEVAATVRKSFHRDCVTGVTPACRLLASVKGAALMIAPEFGVEATDILMRQPQVLMVGIGVDAILPLWLTFAGWRPRPAQPLPT